MRKLYYTSFLSEGKRGVVGSAFLLCLGRRDGDRREKGLLTRCHSSFHWLRPRTRGARDGGKPRWPCDRVFHTHVCEVGEHCGWRFQIASFATVWRSGRFRLCCSAKTTFRQFPLLKHFSGRASQRLEKRRCLSPGRKHLNEPKIPGGVIAPVVFFVIHPTRQCCIRQKRHPFWGSEKEGESGWWDVV